MPGLITVSSVRSIRFAIRPLCVLVITGSGCMSVLAARAHQQVHLSVYRLPRGYMKVSTTTLASSLCSFMPGVAHVVILPTIF